jgi:hypothetical protein
MTKHQNIWKWFYQLRLPFVIYNANAWKFVYMKGFPITPLKNSEAPTSLEHKIRGLSIWYLYSQSAVSTTCLYQDCIFSPKKPKDIYIQISFKFGIPSPPNSLHIVTEGQFTKWYLCFLIPPQISIINLHIAETQHLPLWNHSANLSPKYD